MSWRASFLGAASLLAMAAAAFAGGGYARAEGGGGGVEGAGRAGDWPQWRGPDGSGSAEESGLPARWSEAEGIRWKAPLPGRGLSGPVVARGRAYVTAASGMDGGRLHVLAFDAASGERLWERQLWATSSTQCHPKTNMAAPTPAADGERVCALFATCDLACFDAGGTLLWYRALASDYAEVSNQVGMAASPILWRDLLILALETDSDAFVIALDRKTGRNRWKTPRGKGINWTTPLVARLGAVEDLLLQSRWGLSGYDPATGAERWKHPDPLDSIASPVAGGGSIFAPGGGIVALRPGKEAAAPEVLWKSNRLRAATASPLFYRGRVYAVNSAGVLTCAEPAAGEVEWQERLAGPFSASPVAGDGKIYCANEEGLVAVVDAGASPSGPEAPKRLLGAYPLGEPTLASPAIAAGALYFRTDRHLFCID